MKIFKLEKRDFWHWSVGQGTKRQRKDKGTVIRQGDGSFAPIN